MDDEEFKSWEIQCKDAVKQEKERRDREAQKLVDKEHKRRLRARERERDVQYSHLPLDVKLNLLLQEQDAGFIGNDPRREHVRRAIKRTIARMEGRDPRYGTVGNRSGPIPEDKVDDYRMRCVIRDIMETLNGK